MADKKLNQPSKMMTLRVKSCRAVLWAIETYDQRLLDLLAERFPLPEGGTGESAGSATSFAALLALFKKDLRQARNRLVRADRRLRDHKAAAVAEREPRDQAAAQLSRIVIKVRSAFGGVYGVDKVASFGFAGRTPQDPNALLEQASHLARRLSAPDLELPPPDLDELDHLDAANLAKLLGPPVEKLGEALEAVARAERRAEASKLAKDEAMDAFNRTFLWIARTVESLFQLVGLEEVAKRVRPSTRRAGLTVIEFEEPETEEEAQAPDPEPAEPDTAP